MWCLRGFGGALGFVGVESMLQVECLLLSSLRTEVRAMLIIQIEGRYKCLWQSRVMGAETLCFFTIGGVLAQEVMELVDVDVNKRDLGSFTRAHQSHC